MTNSSIANIYLLSSSSNYFTTTARPLTTNETNGTNAEGNIFSIPKNVIYGLYVFNGILALIGVFGNIFVCFVIVYGRKMYTIANLFLMNLAIADLLILGISYPLWIMQEIIPDSWPFGGVICKIIFPLSDVFYGVSLGCMTAISIHRYRMIIYSMSTQMGFVHAKILIIFFYGISLLTISGPAYPLRKYSHSIHNGIEYRYCYSEWPSWTYERCYLIYLTLCWYLIPLLIILFTYVRIKWYLQKQMKCHWLATSMDDMAMKAHVLGIKSALRLLAPVVIVFSILMLPWNILRVMAVFMRLNALSYVRIYLVVAATMMVFNSAVNPFIYYIMSSEFRSEFKKKISSVSIIFNKLNEGNDNNDVFRDPRNENCRLTSIKPVGSKKKINLGKVAGMECNNNDYTNGGLTASPNFDELFKDYQNNKTKTIVFHDKRTSAIGNGMSHVNDIDGSNESCDKDLSDPAEQLLLPKDPSCYGAVDRKSWERSEETSI